MYDVDNITCRCCRHMWEDREDNGMRLPDCPNVPKGWAIRQKAYGGYIVTFEWRPICKRFEPLHEYHAIPNLRQFMDAWHEQWDQQKRTIPLVQLCNGAACDTVFEVPLRDWQECRITGKNIPAIAEYTWKLTRKGIEYHGRNE